MLNERKILITGGTGSFGRKFVEVVLNKYPNIKRLVIYSRDEMKQYEMAQIFPESKFPQLRFFIGDVRDSERLRRACEGIDIIIHAAALKHVPVAEYNPIECINTNIFGAENIINAALDCKVSKVIALSTDKAAAPINLYGATKLCSDKLFIAANNIVGTRDLKFSVVRYGNVLGSRGSVIPFFLKEREKGVLPITHQDMTRFSISLDEGVDMVLRAIDCAWGGEIFVPKIPSYRITDVAKAVSSNCKQVVIGIRPGEKLHEEMITESDSYNSYDCGDFYVIGSVLPLRYKIEDWMQHFNAVKLRNGFSYTSGNNNCWLSVEQIRELIRLQIDASFECY